MLGREIDAPGNRVFEGLARGQQDLDGVGVVHLGEIGRHEALQTSDSVFIHALGEEFQIVGTFIQHRLEHILQHAFGQAGDVVQRSEGYFRLDHPEFRQVAAGVGVFGAEGWAEGVNLRQRASVGFAVQLAGNGEEGFLTEEVFAEIDGALVGARQVFQIQRGHAEHLTGAFGIGGGDQRSRDPEIPIFMEEAVDRLRQSMTYARHGADQVGARAQVSHFAQVFDAVALGRHRVSVRIVDPADHVDRGSLQFEALAFAR
ncbi:Uncharacterised protein [Acinetobacter baumannii]|nr:Uncharacterised protein [Acinetobacter baumannii]